MHLISHIGERTLQRWHSVRDVAAVIWGVLGLAVRPRFWPRTVRSVTARQILFTGIEALPLILGVSLLVGISVVSQTQLWLIRFGQSAMLGPILVAILVREGGPLIVNLVVVARSGTAIASECASMRVRGEVAVLDAMGLDPMVYLVMPRVLGVALSVFGLTMVFVTGAFVSGSLFGFLIGATSGDAHRLLLSIGRALTPGVWINLLVKTFVTGSVMGAICSMEGLRAGAATTEIPIAASRAVVKSIAGLLGLSALTSVLTYG